MGRLFVHCLLFTDRFIVKKFQALLFVNRSLESLLGTSLLCYEVYRFFNSVRFRSNEFMFVTAVLIASRFCSKFPFSTHETVSSRN